MTDFRFKIGQKVRVKEPGQWPELRAGLILTVCRRGPWDIPSGASIALSPFMRALNKWPAPAIVTGDSL
jgi:hypothetical protein